MELYDFVKLIRNKKKTIFSIVFTTIIIIVAVSFVLPKKYSSELQVLIIQNNLNNTDPYLVSKSSEHLGNILTRVIFSGSFYNKVIDSGFGVGKTYFGDTYKEQLKKWATAISARNIEDTGILAIKATHRDREQAELIVEAIGYVLKTSHKEYHGSGDNVEIKIINEPVTSNFPTEPNIVLNIISGLIVSLVFSFLYIYLFPEKKYDLTLLPKREKKKIKKMKSYLTEDEFEKIGIKNTENSKGKKNKTEKKHFNKEEVYEEDSMEEGDEEFGGYEEENEDDLDVDYNDIKKKGNIENIL